MSTQKRPVPLEHFLYTGNSNKTSDELFLLVDANSKYQPQGYNKSIEAKKSRTKASSTNYGPKGTKQMATPAQVRFFLKKSLTDNYFNNFKRKKIFGYH
jgi:antiviral helicase SKI2